MNKKIIVTLMTFATITLFTCGCGDAKSKLLGQWEMYERPQASTCVFPTTVPNACINNYGECEMELMSDGSILLTAGNAGDKQMNSNKCKYDVVDGKLKIVAPLGTSTFSEYEIEHDHLIITDSDGNSVEFIRK